MLIDVCLVEYSSYNGELDHMNVLSKTLRIMANETTLSIATQQKRSLFLSFYVIFTCILSNVVLKLLKYQSSDNAKC